MPYERDNQRDYYNRRETQDYGRDYGSGRDYSSTSARSYEAMGMDRDDRGRGQRSGSDRDYGRRDYGRDETYGSYGQRDYGNSGYAASDRMNYGRQDRDRSDYGRSDYGRSDYGRGDDARGGYGRSRDYRGSYAADGRRFTNYDRDDSRDRDMDRQRGYGRAPQGYDYEDRGFLARAGDEVRSWFGDDDAERRREADMRYDERYYNDRDADYGNWRRGQIEALDRDYDEYRRENRSKFENEFSTWRSDRQGQRQSLERVAEHMTVEGSDGEHLGMVDKVRGDRILLTKNDASDGHHHSIPSRWIESVGSDKVTLRKTADEAKRNWRDEEGNQALFGDNQRRSNDLPTANDRNLNRSFSGTY